MMEAAPLPLAREAQSPRGAEDDRQPSRGKGQTQLAGLGAPVWKQHRTYSIQRSHPNLEEGYRKGQSTSSKLGGLICQLQKRSDTLGPVLSSALSWDRWVWPRNPMMLNPCRHTGLSPTSSKTHAPATRSRSDPDFHFLCKCLAKRVRPTSAMKIQTAAERDTFLLQPPHGWFYSPCTKTIHGALATFGVFVVSLPQLHCFWPSHSWITPHEALCAAPTPQSPFHTLWP